MNLLLSLITVISPFGAFAAQKQPVTDPASLERYHGSIQIFDAAKGRYTAVPDAGLILDGNETTGIKVPVGQHRFMLSLAKVQDIQRIALVGVGSARFSVSVSNEAAAPGAAWQPVLKNVALSCGWGGDKNVNRTARYILIETDSRSEFALNDVGVYGVLPPVAAPGPRYLSELWNSSASSAPADTLMPIAAGPSKTRGFRPGNLGFPPRVAGSSSVNTVRPAIQAPRPRLSTPPTPAVR